MRGFCHVVSLLILVWDDTIFKKRGGQIFSEIVKTRDFGPPPKHPLPEVV